MKKRKSAFKIKKGLIVYVVAAILLLAVFLPGFVQLQQLKEKNRILEGRIEVLAKYNEELRGSLDRFENDPSYIEQIARDKLGMVKKGEILYRMQKTNAE